ncbi:serine/threonine protein kinase [Pelomonas saccharophila]|uniref:non-specific serine/threonine protein kinase n=1 Tax=Roseateles saccharophilus TaxID=304 RepID=A0ABU1YIK7_ROSSA|nr:serine/threonine-protein kinase [Roseateles saccharophilus]MDR7268687.1 serine/threonine protein kinase [Roseateles saccharophilus]
MSEAPDHPSGRPAPEDKVERTVAVEVQLTPGHTLPPGTRIHDYRIDRVLGEGGFGIVYLATDVALERQVAVKEYLPSSMAARAGKGLTVLVKSAEHAETFAIGLRSFVNEAKLLARFDHPALLKVHQFWEENGTAYMAMPYYQGQTLKESLRQLGRLPTEKEVRAWLMPLLDALEVLHNEHCYHRDIAPDNILLTDHGPLLLDFGAARRVIGDLTHALTAMLKPGFAPIEQYGDMPGVTQGPWTDIFALASVLYAAISGKRTVASVERLLNDQLQPLSTVAAGRCGNAFLSAIDRALAIHPKDRPQSIAEFRTLLTAHDTQAIDLLQLQALGLPTGEETVLLPDFDPTQMAPTAPAPAPREPTRTQPASPPPAPAQPPALPPTPPVQPAPPQPRPTAAPVQAHLPAQPRRNLLFGAVGAVGLAAVAWEAYRLLATPAPAPAQLPPASAPAPAAAPEPVPVASAPQPIPAASAPDLPASTAPPPPAPTPASAPAPAAPAPTPASAASAVPKPRPAAPAPAPVATKGAKCSDILQKASLEPLTASEAAYLKKECR